MKLLDALLVIEDQPERIKDGPLKWAVDYAVKARNQLVVYRNTPNALTEGEANDIHWMLLRARGNMHHWRGTTAKEVKRAIDRVLEEAGSENYWQALREEL